MGAPVKPEHQRVSIRRVSVYLPHELNALLERDMLSHKAHSKSDRIRHLLYRALMPGTKVDVIIKDD